MPAPAQLVPAALGEDRAETRGAGGGDDPTWPGTRPFPTVGACEAPSSRGRSIWRLRSSRSIPQLASQPGVVDSDTKSYLFIDPTRFVAQSASMWDPDIALGTVTHQQLGYSFPMGPFFMLTHSLGIAVWVSQRLWVGGTLFAAGAGVVYLAHTLKMRGPGVLVAGPRIHALALLLAIRGRISVILLAWAALPWLVALVAGRLDQGGWRYPALFALVALAAGGVNASSLIYVGVGPLLWLPYAVLVTRERPGGRCGGFSGGRAR